MLDKLQIKMTQQRDIIAQLKEDSESLQKLKARNIQLYNNKTIKYYTGYLY